MSQNTTSSMMTFSVAPFAAPGNAGLRRPSLDSTTHLLIALVVIAPLLFLVLLCLIAYCIYRCQKQRSARLSASSPTVPRDRSNPPVPTIIHNTQHSPFIFEDLPPAYDSLSDKKKDPHASTFRTNEQVQLTMFPHPTLTNISERVGTTGALPIAPSAPSYIYSDRSNKL